MTTILTLLAMIIFSTPEGARTVRAGQTVTVNVTRTTDRESNPGNTAVHNNPLYATSGNSGSNPLSK